MAYASVVLGTTLCATTVHADDATTSPAAAGERRIVFQSTKSSAELQRRDPTGSNDWAWRPVCKGSCSIQASVGAQFRVGGAGVVDSDTFVVVPGDGPLWLRARAGSSAGQGAGALALVLGGACVVGGLLSWFHGVASTADCAGCSDHGKAATGRIVFVLGFASLVTGIALVASNSTKLEFDPKQPSSARLELGRGVALGVDGLRF